MTDFKAAVTEREAQMIDASELWRDTKLVWPKNEVPVIARVTFGDTEGLVLARQRHDCWWWAVGKSKLPEGMVVHAWFDSLILPLRLLDNPTEFDS